MVIGLSPAPDPVGGAAAQRAARAELARDGYQHRHSVPNPITRLTDWIGRRLGDLLGGGAGGHGLLLLLLIAVVVAVVFGVRAGAPSLRRRPRTATDADPLAAQAATDHRRQARELAAQGRRAEALREWLRAAVQTIEERGVLPPRPGRTGAATAREAGPLLPTAAVELGRAMTAFDEVWFGGRPATDADVEAGRAAADAARTARISRGGDVGTSVPSGMAAPW